VPVGQRNIDELGGVSMSRVPTAQPVTVCCHRLRPTPGDAAEIKVLQVSKPVFQKGRCFFGYARVVSTDDQNSPWPFQIVALRGLIPAVLAVADTVL
jgi:hypothetical protein